MVVDVRKVWQCRVAALTYLLVYLLAVYDKHHRISL